MKLLPVHKKQIYIIVTIILLTCVCAIYKGRQNIGDCCELVAQCDSLDIIHLEYAHTLDSQLQKTEQLIEHIGYTVSYNHQWNIPNWVAYELTSNELEGNEARSNHFKPDPLVYGDPIVTSDYSHSGFDRGHMAPAADMKWSQQAMDESFYMTNICPQNHSSNAGDWKDLEEFVRDLARKYGSIYVVVGPIVTSSQQTIGTLRKIVVPSSFYKALLRQKSDGTWVSIGFILPNSSSNKPLLTYMVPVDSIERLINIDLFYQLPDSIETSIEIDYNEMDWII